jgi:hypothetical protein
MVILNGLRCRCIQVLQPQVSSDPGDGILQKLGDDCPCECDAPPNGLGWASHHLCAKWRGISQSKRFTSSGTESGMGCVGVVSAAGKTERGGSNMD